MTIALWAQLILAFTLLIGVCAFARSKASSVALPVNQGNRTAPAAIRLAA